MNKISRTIQLSAVLIVASLVFDSHAAPNAFIPPKYKDMILYAPMPDYPMQARNRYTVGAQGIFRLKVNFQTGAVEEIGVMKRANSGTLNAAMVMDLLKWKFKPGTIHQIDIPVVFEDPIRAELRNATTR